MTNQAGKGDKQRPTNHANFSKNFDTIFATPEDIARKSLEVSQRMRDFNAALESKADNDRELDCDPYATEEETKAILVSDTRTLAERKLAAMIEDNFGNEQGAELELVLRQVALQLIEQAEKPLTDEQIAETFCKAPKTMTQLVAWFAAGVRYAEAAHNINAANAAQE